MTDSNSTTYIYGLKCPVTGYIRYVGKADKPMKRLREHLFQARHSSVQPSSEKVTWLRELLSQNLKPSVVLLETVPPAADWSDSEQHWIARLIADGDPLTNQRHRLRIHEIRAANALRTPQTYRQWWQETYPGIPYGQCVCGCGNQTSLARKSSSDKGHVSGEPLRYVHNHHLTGLIRQDKRLLTEEQKSEFCQRYLNGESTPALAREYGVNAAVIAHWLRKYGIRLRTPPNCRRHDPKMMHQARELYCSGVSGPGVVKQFPISLRSLYDTLRKHNIPTHGKHHHPSR